MSKRIFVSTCTLTPRLDKSFDEVALDLYKMELQRYQDIFPNRRLTGDIQLRYSEIEKSAQLRITIIDKGEIGWGDLAQWLAIGIFISAVLYRLFM